MTANAGVHQKGTFTLQDALDNIKKDPNFPKAGAIVTFVGVVRGETLEGEKVQGLTLDAYEEKATEVLAKIAAEMMQKHGVVNVQIHHLLGEFNVGDELVYVAVAGSHRTDVFPVLREAVERYKHEAPIFKKELTVDKQGVAHADWVSEKQVK